VRELVSKNADFWDHPRPYLDTIVAKPVSDTAVKADAIAAGSADGGIFPSAPAEVKRVQQFGLPVYGIPEGSLGVTFNMSRTPLDDVRVRQALVLASDVDDVNAKAFAGAATPVDTWFPKGSPMYDPSLVQKTDNLKRAQKLIDAYVVERGPAKARHPVRHG
jgi:ABC-type transport system substrate-binding protein